MTHMFPIFRILGLTAILIATSAGPIQAQIYVLESSADSVKVGSAYALSDRITVPAGTSVRAVMPSGKTQTIKGPFSGAVADLAKGQKPNEGVIAWIKDLMQTGGSTEKTPGATRSARIPEVRISFSWTAVPVTVDSTVCIEKGTRLQLLRAPSNRADRVTVVDQASAERGDVEWAAGIETAAWPAAVTLRPDTTYILLAPDNRPRRQITLRLLDSLPGEDDILAELQARGCRYQFDALVKEKIAGAKRKAS